MRVLILNQAFHPDVVATAQQASSLAVRLIERGHEVTVLCSRRAYDSPKERYAQSELWRGVRIRRISCSGLGKKTRWRRAADFASYMANCCIHLATLPRFDVVVAMTSPPLISWLGALFAAVKGGRFVFWVMDLNPDEALAAGWLRSDSWTTKRLQGMLNFSLQRAATVVVLDRFMAKRVIAKGIAAEKVSVIPPWSYDHIRQDAEGRQRFRQQHGLDGKHVVMYSGNHSPCHPLTTLLEAARRLDEHKDIAFCFVGGGSEFDTVRKFVGQYGLTNTVTLPYQPLETLAASLSAADLHVVVMGDPFVGIVHPCKVYNIQALGIPYLYIGPADSHVTKLSPAFAASHGNVDGVINHIVTSARVGASPLSRGVAKPPSPEHLMSQMVVALEEAAFFPAGHQQRILDAG